MIGSEYNIEWSACTDVERGPGRCSGQWVAKDSRILGSASFRITTLAPLPGRSETKSMTGSVSPERAGFSSTRRAISRIHAARLMPDLCRSDSWSACAPVRLASRPQAPHEVIAARDLGWDADQGAAREARFAILVTAAMVTCAISKTWLVWMSR